MHRRFLSGRVVPTVPSNRSQAGDWLIFRPFRARKMCLSPRRRRDGPRERLPVCRRSPDDDHALPCPSSEPPSKAAMYRRTSKASLGSCRPTRHPILGLVGGRYKQTVHDCRGLDRGLLARWWPGHDAEEATLERTLPVDAVQVTENGRPPRVYQDLVLDGRTVVAGRRDCRPRWEALLPHLPRAGTMLDVGSNLGWFSLKMAETFPRCVVASVEADEISAEWQRKALASHATRRICLLTHRADRRLAEQFVRGGQRFDAVLCLSVLHWLPDHRQLLAALGPIARRIFIEQPDPRESGAGTERLRQEIGPIGPYLESLFPERPRRRIGRWSSHRASPYPRELWLVDEPPDADPRPSPGLEVDAVAALEPSWPPRELVAGRDRSAWPRGIVRPGNHREDPVGARGAGRRADGICPRLTGAAAASGPSDSRGLHVCPAHEVAAADTPVGRPNASGAAAIGVSGRVCPQMEARAINLRIPTCKAREDGVYINRALRVLLFPVAHRRPVRAPIRESRRQQAVMARSARAEQTCRSWQPCRGGNRRLGARLWIATQGPLLCANRQTPCLHEQVAGANPRARPPGCYLTCHSSDGRFRDALPE